MRLPLQAKLGIFIHPQLTLKPVDLKSVIRLQWSRLLCHEAVRECKVTEKLWQSVSTLCDRWAPSARHMIRLVYCMWGQQCWGGGTAKWNRGLRATHALNVLLHLLLTPGISFLGKPSPWCCVDVWKFCFSSVCKEALLLLAARLIVNSLHFSIYFCTFTWFNDTIWMFVLLIK